MPQRLLLAVIDSNTRHQLRLPTETMYLETELKPEVIGNLSAQDFCARFLYARLRAMGLVAGGKKEG